MSDRSNRWLACREIGVEPRFTSYKGDQPASYVISKNFHRRHLNKSQSAMISTEFKPLLEEEARKRQIELAGTRKTDLQELIPEGEQGQARDKAGELFNVSGLYVSDAEKIKQKAPEFVEPIMKGEMTIKEQIKQIRELFYRFIFLHAVEKTKMRNVILQLS